MHVPQPGLELGGPSSPRGRFTLGGPATADHAAVERGRATRLARPSGLPSDDGAAVSATASPAPGAVLVATKLHVPAVRAGAVSRRELIERLSGRGGGKLVLLCAPAGWGKTTLVSEWCASEQEGRRFAWVSLDASDSDPVRFWSYLIAALRTVEPELGGSSLAALAAAGPALVDARSSSGCARTSATR